MKNNNLLKNSGVQSMLASLMCILVGMLVGYIALLIINAEGAAKAITTIIKNFYSVFYLVANLLNISRCYLIFTFEAELFCSKYKVYF